MKRIVVIDCTGPNARCNACKSVVGDKVISYLNNWWCSDCLESVKKLHVEQVVSKEIATRKMKKRGRTLKSYILDRLQEASPLSVATLAQEARDNALTSAENNKAAMITVSATISQLRKNGYPVERVSRGIYKWRGV